MTVEFKLPELGENIESGDVVKILVGPGDQIAANQPVCELETDKAVVEITSTMSGKIAKVHFNTGDTILVGQTLLTLEGDGAQAADSGPAPTEDVATPEPSITAARPAAATPAAPVALPSGGPIPAGPAARRLARELGVDLTRVVGSGARGRITTEDVAAGSTGSPATPAAASGQTPAGVPVGPPLPVVPPGEPSEDGWGAVRRERMSKVRRTIAKQMSLSAATIPHVTNFDDADVTDLESLRKGVPKGYLGENVKLTSMPFLLKAVATALRRHPLLNASLEDKTEEVVYKEYVHLGVAVDTPRGLVVPKLRDVDRKGIAQIAAELVVLAQKARSVQFSIEDLRGGTFTISNLGAVGGTYSTPIINHPESAILLAGRSRWLPVVRDGRTEPRLMMPLSLSYDHRLVDGAAAARFLNEVIDYLQSPGKLLLLP